MRLLPILPAVTLAGAALAHVVHLLKSRNPARLNTIALLDKPTRREVDVTADRIGFEIPDEFVVGHGIDCAQRNRNLHYIGKVRFMDAPPHGNSR